MHAEPRRRVPIPLSVFADKGARQTHNRIIDPMSEQPLVGVVMGSKSDYEVLAAAVEILRALEIPMRRAW
jgi:hypothetical protein